MCTNNNYGNYGLLFNYITENQFASAKLLQELTWRLYKGLSSFSKLVIRVNHLNAMTVGNGSYRELNGGSERYTRSCFSALRLNPTITALRLIAAARSSIVGESLIANRGGPLEALDSLYSFTVALHLTREVECWTKC